MDSKDLLYDDGGMKTVSSLVLAIGLIAMPLRALAIDLQPNDIVAPTPGITAVTVSYINSQNNNFYLNGLAVGGSPNLENNSALFRLGHTYTIAGLPGVTYVQTGAGILSPDGSIASDRKSTRLNSSHSSVSRMPSSA